MRSTDALDGLIHMLYEIAEDAEAPANSRLSAIKEILDRTIGKGTRLTGEDDETETIEILFRIENEPSNSA